MKSLASAGLVLLCTACSTGRIDVDIYKGPLTNEQDVQMHQLAAFAVGVKPVLVHIRDEMESASRHIHVAAWRALADYHASAMRPVTALGERAFTSREAEYVNAVLQLYQAAAAERDASVTTFLRAILERYAENYAVVNAVGDAGKADRRVWDAVTRAVPALANAEATSIAGRVKAFLVVDEGKPRPAEELVKALRTAKDGTNRLAESVQCLRLPLSNGKAAPLPDAANELDDALGVYSSYDLLSRPEPWTRIAEHLLGEEPKFAGERFALAERGQRVARAFLAACEAVETAFEKSLEAVADLDARTESGKQEGRKLLLVAANLVNAKRLEKTIAKVHPSREAEILRILKDLRSATDSRPTPESRAEQALDRILPLYTSQREFALAWSRLWMESRKPDAAKMGREPWRDADAEWAAWHGFLAGPVRGQNEKATATEETTAEAAPDAMLRVLPDEGLGFASGRLREGLDQSITRFFTLFHEDPGSARTARRQLMAGLVQFAEKLRPVPVLAQLADVAVDPRFVTLTESIANSISTQVDALERSYDWMGDPEGAQQQDQEAKVARTEIEGWNGALTTSRPASSPLQARTALGLNARATDVIDALIARLEYLRIDTVAQGGADTKAAMDLQAALDLAHAHRTGMVKLLPAATYLRNSYPSSSLQGLPLFYETSILGDRGTPILDYGKKELAVVMDKQYWQTVNTIAVTGVGDTNSVLVKDDLGNWTIKSYSGNPKDIVAAMKQLALYATGAGISPAALVQADQLKAVLAKSHAGTALEQADKDLLANAKTSSGGQGKAILAAQWKQANTRAKAALGARRGELVKSLGAAIATWDPKPALTAAEVTDRIEKAVPALALDATAVDGGLASWLALRKAEAAFLAECGKTPGTLAAALQKPAGTSTQPSTEEAEKKLAAIVAPWLAETRKARLALVRETRRALEVVDEASAAQR